MTFMSSLICKPVSREVLVSISVATHQIPYDHQTVSLGSDAVRFPCDRLIGLDLSFGLAFRLFYFPLSLRFLVFYHRLRRFATLHDTTSELALTSRE